MFAGSTKFDGWIAWYQNPGASGASGLSRSRQLAVDSSGNIYYGFYVFISSGIYAAIMKVNSTGTVQWARQLAPPVASGFMYCRDIGIDASANVYIVMAYNNFGGAREPAYIAKYNSSGTIQWQRQLTDTSAASTSLGAYAVGVEYSGSNIASFGPSATSVGANFSVVSRTQSAGGINFQKTLGTKGANGADFDRVYGCAVDSSGNIYVAGSSSESSFGNSDLVVAKYTSAGTLLFQQKLGNGSQNYASKCAVDSSGNLFVCTTDGTNTVLTKWNSSLVLQWQKYDSTNINATVSCCVDSLGNIFTIGIHSSGPRNTAISKWDTSGNILWTNYISFTGVTDTGDFAIATMQSGTGLNDYVYVSFSATTSAPNYYVTGAKLPANGSRAGFSGTFGGNSVSYVAAATGTTTNASMSNSGFGGADATSSFTDSAGAGTDSAISPSTVTQIQTFP
jgi:hypothetical protein